ncbi:MAG: iron-containing alcohol dehydrogenase, partial [Clostridia bacterium]
MQMVQGVCGAARYPIYIGQGMIAQAGALLHAWRGRRVAVIADDCTAAHYGASLCDALRTAQMTPCLLTVPQGEKSKCEATLFDLYERLMDAGITRADAIVALGGGVVGDLA